MLYYFPASIALIIKLALIFYAKDSLLQNKLSSTLFVVLTLLAICNVLEIVGIAKSSDAESIEVFLRIYYVSLILLFTFLLHLSVLIVKDKVGWLFEFLNYGVGLILCALALYSNLLLAGIESIGYSVTRVPGVLFWLLPAYAIVCFIVSLFVLYVGVMKSKDRFKKIRSIYILLGNICLTIPILIAVFLMIMGVKINATLLFPIGTSLFLVVISYAVKSHNLFDIRFWLPFSSIYKLHKAIFREYLVAEDGSEPSALERRNNHEKIYMLRLLIDNDNNQAAVSRILGISESTVSKKRRKYDI